MAKFKLTKLHVHLCEQVLDVHYDAEFPEVSNTLLYETGHLQCDKENSFCEPYILKIDNYFRKTAVAKLRLPAHKFLLEIGRYYDITRMDRCMMKVIIVWFVQLQNCLNIGIPFYQ